MMKSLTIRRMIAFVLTACLFLGLCLPINAADTADWKDTMELTGAYLTGAVPKPQLGSVGGEWAVLGLARSGTAVPKNYYEDYYARIEDSVKACKGVLHAKKYTEYSRVILALTAIGKDPTNVAGYNLLIPLGDYDRTVWQGSNGPIWALIALDSGGYAVPTNTAAATQATRQKYVDAVLAARCDDGGWSLGGKTGEPDLTAMALQAMAPYRSQKAVEAAVQRGLSCLAALQNTAGGFSAWNTENAESSAQVLVTLCTLGIPLTDARFVKNGHSVLDGLLSFARPDGSFCHDKADGTANQMSTEQAYYALAALNRMQRGQTALYDMSDAVASARSGFSDLNGHPNQQTIEKLAAAGIVSGMGDGTFAPNRTMTRAEFCTIVVKAIGLPQKTTKSFFDVASNAWYAGYVGAASAAGIVSGMGDGIFAPDATITREQAMAMVCRAARTKKLDTNVTDADAILRGVTGGGKVSAYAKPAVAYCLHSGLWTDAGALQPQTAIRRCEVAQMVYELCNLTGALE